MIKFFAVAAIVATIGTAPAAAVTYDAFTSFNGTQGAGNFTYGSFDGTTFTAFTGANGCASLISNVTCLSSGGLPGVFKSTTGAHQSGTVIVPGDALILHPGPNAGQTSVILFTAPTSGMYSLSYSGTVADTNPSGVILFGLQFNTIFPLATLTAGNPTFSSGASGHLNAGQQIGIGIDYDGVYYNDSTAVNVTFTGGGTVPEPANWALLIAGFGLTGAAMRRRRAVAAAA